jgi:hypothetical protein
VATDDDRTLDNQRFLHDTHPHLEFVNNEIRHNNERASFTNQAASQKVRGVAEITQLTRNPAPSPRGSLARLRSRSCIIDGEAVACDDNGVASFDLIRHHRANGSVFLYAFDLIELNGDDLRRDPLEVRKAQFDFAIVLICPDWQRPFILEEIHATP